MKLVESKVEEIKFIQYGKKIEKAGRVCYKSDSNISDTSYIKFIQNIVKSGLTVFKSLYPVKTFWFEQ